MKKNIAEIGKLIEQPWQPRIVGELNGQEVKLAKFEGEFGWHFHEKEDELFLVMDGAIELRLRGETVYLGAGEFFVVPKGVEHNPYSEQSSLVMLFEPASTLNTGNLVNEKTVLSPERM